MEITGRRPDPIKISFRLGGASRESTSTGWYFNTCLDIDSYPLLEDKLNCHSQWLFGKHADSGTFAYTYQGQHLLIHVIFTHSLSYIFLCFLLRLDGTALISIIDAEINSSISVLNRELKLQADWLNFSPKTCRTEHFSSKIIISICSPLINKKVGSILVTSARFLEDLESHQPQQGLASLVDPERSSQRNKRQCVCSGMSPPQAAELNHINGMALKADVIQCLSDTAGKPCLQSVLGKILHTDRCVWTVGACSWDRGTPPYLKCAAFFIIRHMSRMLSFTRVPEKQGLSLVFLLIPIY